MDVESTLDVHGSNVKVKFHHTFSKLTNSVIVTITLNQVVVLDLKPTRRSRFRKISNPTSLKDAVSRPFKFLNEILKEENNRNWGHTASEGELENALWDGEKI